MSRSIGIDLGTTNSVGSYVDEKGHAVIIASRDNLRYTPSVVGLPRRKKPAGEDDGNLLVGLQALNNVVAAPKDTIYSFKRLMGRALEDERVKAARRRLTYDISAGDGDDPGAYVMIGGKRYSPEALSALVLKQIREDANEVGGLGPVTRAVITVPAYFEERQREATRKAGALAGFSVRMILDEPVAAAIAHGAAAAERVKRRLLVLDLGGGTFDISVVQQAGTRFQVLQTGGDMWLGGDDFDRAVITLIENKMRAQNFPVPEDARSRFMLRLRAEEAKRSFASRPIVDVVLEGIRGPSGLVDFVCEIERTEFERAIEPQLTRIEELVVELLHKQNLSVEMFEYALLVGGSSALPQFKSVVRKIFGDRVCNVADPMECVARGAALVAHSLVGITCIKRDCSAPENSDDALSCQSCGTSLASARPAFKADGQITSIVTPIPRALGIGCREGADSDAYQILIPEGTPYPMSQTKECTFRLGAGDSVILPIYEGSDKKASRNLPQGTVRLKPPSQLKPGDPVIVGLNYTRNRTLHITISYPTLNKRELFDLNSTPQAVPRPAHEDDWGEQLIRQAEQVRRFLSGYSQYIEPRQRQQLEQQLNRADSMAFTAPEAEIKQQTKAMQVTMWQESSLAASLFAAEAIRQRAAPSVAAELEKLAEELRRAHAAGDRSQTARLLNLLENKIRQEVELQSAQNVKMSEIGLLEKTPAPGFQ